jgi:hypothetical protein
MVNKALCNLHFLQIEIPHNLLNEVQPCHDLVDLSNPFIEEEIDRVVGHLPIVKVPGPDGYNGKFMKSCWHIIKDDFYFLCQEFHENNISLQCLNDSIITLIPNMSSPKTPNDIREISLLN